MFSEVSVYLGGGSAYFGGWGRSRGIEGVFPGDHSPVVTSSGGHCSGRYASY